MDKHYYKKSSHWNLLMEDNNIFITAGLDEIYLVDELSKEQAIIIYESYKNDSFNNLDFNNEEIRNTISKLEKAGVIYKGSNLSISQKSRIKLSIKWIGGECLEIQKLLESFAKKYSFFTITEQKVSDLMIIIRSSGKLSEVVGDYGKIKTPHLFVDVAYHHTISLGPFVFLDDTACLGCFVGRITKKWGDAKSPLISNTSNCEELIASLILKQIIDFYETGSCPLLVEKSWSFNLSDLTSQFDDVFHLPWCPFCYPEEKKQLNTEAFDLF